MIRGHPVMLCRSVCLHCWLNCWCWVCKLFAIRQLQWSFAWNIFSTCVGGCWVAKPRSNLRMKGRAGRERNFFQTSASRLIGEFRTTRNGWNYQAHKFNYVKGFHRVPLGTWHTQDLLFGIWDMFLHVVQCTLRYSFLENKIFELMAVAVVFDSSSNFTEAIQKYFVICTMLLVIPEGKKARSQFHFHSKQELNYAKHSLWNMVARAAHICLKRSAWFQNVTSI